MKLIFVLVMLAQDPSKENDLEKRVEALEKRLGEFNFRLYGFARLDVIYDDSRMNNTQVPIQVLSEDPTAPPAIRAKENDEDMTIHPKLTRLGIDVTGPAVAALGDARLSGKVEIDFYNATASDSREAVRMRHAYVRLSWPTVEVYAGQREDLISPLFPTVNNDMVNWNAGNLGDRRPQLRVEWRPAPPYLVSLMAGQTGAVDNQNLMNLGIKDGEDAGVPTLQARVAYQRELFVEKQPFVLGVWGHWAKEETEALVGGEDEFTSEAFGADLTLPLTPELWLKAEVWTGRNLDDVRGGIGQGINATTGEEIESRGGWVEVGYKVIPEWTVVAGASLDSPEDGDLPAAGASLNRLYWLGNRFSPGGALTLGLDWIHWVTDYKGFDEGDSNRFYLFVQWNF